MARTTITNEQRRELGRRGMRAVLSKKIDPTGELARRDPAEFERQYEVAKQEHMTEMVEAHRASAARIRAEKAAAKTAKASAPRALKPAPPVPFLWSCCPPCNAENNVTLPPGIPTALCVAHYLAGKPWYPLGAHEWAIRKPWLVDGSLQVKTSRAN